MKKLILLTALIFVVAFSAGNATLTRTLTMGDNNNIMIDDANVRLYPSRVSNYPNIGSGEFCEGEMYYFGVNWKFNENNPWFLGTYFSTEWAETPYSFRGNRYFGTEFESFPSNRRVDLLLGHKLGSLNIGLGLTYVNSSQSPEDTAYNYDHSYSRYGFTLGLTPDNGVWDLASYLSLATWKENYTFSEDGAAVVYLAEPDGYNDIEIRGRYFFEMNPTITLVPHADLAFGEHTGLAAAAATDGAEIYAEAIGYSSKLFSFGAGCGMNYTPVKNVLAVLDVGFTNRNVKEDTAWLAVLTDINGIVIDEESGEGQWKQSTMILPYWKLGLEGEVFSWLDVRFGVTSNWTATKIENISKTNYAANTSYLGLGFNWNRLHIDTYTDPELFLRGFDFISGRGNNEGGTYMNWQLSVRYEMF
ncbi:MAG: hypothetical protein NT002_13375 [candidate division Zixibacteria bacterium]|nr:hypothetical protein [candidate division Zixibacteria bacterium]